MGTQRSGSNEYPQAMFLSRNKQNNMGTQRSGSNEYPQALFLSRNKQNNVYPCKHQFYYIYYIKVGFKGVKII